jgi:hypothetical protein
MAISPGLTGILGHDGAHGRRQRRRLPGLMHGGSGRGNVGFSGIWGPHSRNSFFSSHKIFKENGAATVAAAPETQTSRTLN